MFWVGDQGEGTSPNCTLYFSDFRTSFSFSLWLGEWDHFTRRTETFQKISNMYGYFLYTLYCMGFQWILGGEGRGEWCLYQVHRVDRQYRVWTPQCAASWMIYARDSFVDSPSVLRPGCYCYICKRQFCGFPQCAASSRGWGGPDILVPGLQYH